MKVFKLGQIKASTLAAGSRVSALVMEHSQTQMKTNMKVTSRTIVEKAMASKRIKMVPHMLVIGRMTSSTERVPTSGQIKLNTQGIGTRTSALVMEQP